MIIKNRQFQFREILLLSVVKMVFLLLLLVQCTRIIQPDTIITNNDLVKYTNDQGDSIGITLIQPPVVINSNTCPRPQIIAVPTTKGGSYIIKQSKTNELIYLEPPIKVIASFNSFMQNYNTEQGLALSSISEGSKSSICDRQGNLWFGTQGGGVSRFDGKSFTNFTMDQGLASNLVQCIIEDHLGNIWFGTDGGGISRFDGFFFTNYSTDQGLAGNVVNSIIEDKTGIIWIGTHSGLSSYDGKYFTNYTTDDGLADNIVYSILQDKNGILWFGTEGGVSSYEPFVLTNITKKPFNNLDTTKGLAANKVYSIMEDRLGNLWFGTEGGISWYDRSVSRGDGKLFINFNSDQGLINNKVNSILEDKIGTLWFGTDGGVSSYNPSAPAMEGEKIFTNFTTAQGLVNNIVNSIVEDKLGTLWFGTNGSGISRYDGSSFTNYTELQGLSNNLVFSLTEDKKGNLWFGTWGGGVSCYNGNYFTKLTTKQGLVDNTVNCITVDDNGNIWFGTDRGVSFYNGKTFTNYSIVQGLANGVVNTILKDSHGKIWFGTVDGLSCYDGKTFTNFTTAQGLVNNRIYSLKQDKTGKIWVGTDGGLSCYNPYALKKEENPFTNFTTNEGLADDRVYSITEDSSGFIWFGTYKGVSRYDGNSQPVGQASFMNYTTTEGLADNSVMAVLQDLKGTIWMGTNKGFSGLSFQIASNSMDVEQGVVNELMENKTILAGLLNVSNAELKNYNPVWAIYNNQTGYPVKDVNGGSNNGAMICDSKGIIWAGTGDVKTALVRFDANAVLKSSEPPMVVLKSIKINGENISWHNLQQLTSKKLNQRNTNDSLTIINEEYYTFGKILTRAERKAMYKNFSGIKFDSINRFYPIPQNLILPYAQNNVTFEFNTVVTSQNFRVKYQYMLEGYDQHWSPVTEKASASFGNIFEGAYIFTIKACSPDGVWCEPITYSFRVLPPWWRTWGMYSIYIIGFICAIYLVFRWQMSKLKREKQVLEEKVLLRTAELYQANEEITAQRDDIEEQRDEIEAQRDIVTLQKEQIEVIHKKVSDSINYAKRIQQAVLPSENFAEGILSEHFILFKPKDVVSGDFYWTTKINEWFIFTVADCTGHGVPGAFMSMLGISFLNEIVRKKEVITASEVLEQLRSSIIDALHQTAELDKQKDGIDIGLCVLNMNTLELQFSGANNPIYIASNDLNELKKIKGDKMTLAISPKMMPFNNHVIQTKKGDIIYLITDGFQDQFGGPDDWKFSSKKLEQLLFDNFNKPLPEQKEILSKTIEDWMYYGNGINFEQTDDITIMGIKI